MRKRFSGKRPGGERADRTFLPQWSTKVSPTRAQLGPRGSGNVLGMDEKCFCKCPWPPELSKGARCLHVDISHGSPQPQQYHKKDIQQLTEQSPVDSGNKRKTAGPPPLPRGHVPCPRASSPAPGQHLKDRQPLSSTIPWVAHNIYGWVLQSEP